MLSQMMLRNWIYQLPPPVIRLARRMKHMVPSGPVVHTQASWHKVCQSALRVIGGTVGTIEGSQCTIAWPAVGSGSPTMTASLRVNPSSDLDVFCQVWTDQHYRAVVKYMRKWVTATDELRIIDAGANVGFTTLYLKAQFPNAHVISLEPEESNYAQMTHNVARNALENVTPLQAGLWKSQAFLEVGRDTYDQREWSFYVREVPGPTTLPGYDVQALLRQARWDSVDLLKMDIEGAERYLFADDHAAAQTLGNVRFLALEIHDADDLRARIYRQLRQRGFEFFDSGELTIAHNTAWLPQGN